MGIINTGILGKINGKTGPVVGGSWKGINYLRSYVKPRNPNTENQQAQRLLFGKTVRVAQTLNVPVLQNYWNANLNKQSAYNRYIQLNSQLAPTNQFLASLNQLAFQGSLPEILFDEITYIGMSGIFVASWDPQNVPYPFLGTDKIFLYIINIQGEYLGQGEGTVADGNIELTLKATMDYADMLVGITGVKNINGINYTDKSKYRVCSEG